MRYHILINPPGIPSIYGNGLTRMRLHKLWPQHPWGIGRSLILARLTRLLAKGFHIEDYHGIERYFSAEAK